ncbi:MAG: GNAT family N-acetyltransferase [Mogibacterium sp.]|nr:GNAT family N-acetyltransferase [Mogibacterium sp.]
MTEADREEVLAMMRVFYASDAVQSDGSEEIFNRDIDACISDSPFASGYIFVKNADEKEDGSEAGSGSIEGYAMLAHSFSTEFGVPAVWIEEIYLKEEARGQGLAGMLFDLIKEEYPGHLQRLEVEDYNTGAVRSYEKNGFTTRLLYSELVRLPE